MAYLVEVSMVTFPKQLVDAASRRLLTSCALLVLATTAVYAQQTTTGAPGSPSATTTIPGGQLPAPPPPFRGKIERNAAQSTPYWPARVVPPKGAPNVLLIMTDDTGFGASSTSRGVSPTPNLDHIAASGLHYTNFNSTALCSPTRRADHRTKPSFDGLRGRRRAGDGLSRLRQHHDPGQGDDRKDPQ